MRSLIALALLVTACSGTAEPLDAGIDAGSDAGIARDAGHDAPTDAPVDARPSPGQAFVGPATLSETGLYADLAAGTIADGVMPYGVRFELWADGATKQRWLWLPPGTVIDTRDPDRWVFPVGTRSWKEFSVDGARVETRYLVKVEEDRWENVAYVWRADGSDADAVPEGVVDARGTTHDVPAIDGCYDCHRGDVDGLNAVSALQLATGATDDLLVRLETAGLLSDPIASTAIPGTELEQSALGYLHANCAHCHDAGHPLSAFRALRMRLPLGLADAADAPARVTTVGAEMRHAIEGTTIAVVAGDPTSSQVWRRMQLRGDEHQMPSRGTEQVDPAADVVRLWIESLAAP